MFGEGKAFAGREDPQTAEGDRQEMSTLLGTGILQAKLLDLMTSDRYAELYVARHLIDPTDQMPVDPEAILDIHAALFEEDE